MCHQSRMCEVYIVVASFFFLTILGAWGPLRSLINSRTPFPVSKSNASGILSGVALLPVWPHAEQCGHSYRGFQSMKIECLPHTDFLILFNGFTTGKIVSLSLHQPLTEYGILGKSGIPGAFPPPSSVLMDQSCAQTTAAVSSRVQHPCNSQKSGGPYYPP